ncbi:MAG: serine/threonine protein kinase, partial [Gemmataceae bacterium]|nr:serine/threonine protein kinase [Gemmataceae bacterium]
MAIACPYCAHKLTLKSAKPGRYRPRCPGCDKPFILWVPEEAGTEVQVRGLTGQPAREPRQPAGSVAAFALAIPGEVGGPVSDPAPSGGVNEPLPPDHVFGFARTNPQPADDKGAGKPPGDKEPDDPRLPAKTTFQGYAVEREIGRGGMGTVYLATQLSLDRPVALKVMSRRWAKDPIFVARFTREAFAAAQLSHPNIVQIHDIGEVEGARFFSMEYVRGKSLSDLLRVQGKLDPETAVGYILQAARGLKHAHDRGMIHRDVKPDNLLLDEQGLVKVADLGLVKTPATTRADDT